MTTTSRYPLQLQKSLLDEVERLAADEGTTVDQFINMAVAEKAAALRTAAYFRTRAARADLTELDRILAKSGTEPPRPGDEIPAHGSSER